MDRLTLALTVAFVAIGLVPYGHVLEQRQQQVARGMDAVLSG